MLNYQGVCTICRVRKVLKSKTAIDKFKHDHTINRNKTSKYMYVKKVKSNV